MGRTLTEQYAHLPAGPYDIPLIHQEVGAVFSNTAPLGVTRGPGFAEAANMLERLVDRAARETGMDRVALRRLNLIAELPHRTPQGAVIDSGRLADNLDRAVAASEAKFGTAPMGAARRAAEAQGRLFGVGFACHIKGTFGVPEENVELRFLPASGGDGERVVLTTGTQAIGQGHETTFPQIVAGLLGVPVMAVGYAAGDTDLLPKGGGHGSSRATSMAGTAIHMAVERVVARGRRIAAAALETAEADVAFADGRFTVVGTDRSLGLLEVAALAREQGEPGEGRPGDPGAGLDTYHHYVRKAHTYPNGVHAAAVEIDPETGTVRLIGYLTVDDFGTVVNPLVLAGQVHGAIAQGVGQALMERAVHEAGTAQLLSGSFMDYALPRADDLPAFDIAFDGVPCTTNPLGVKGAGEAGAIAAFPAVANAVLDALAPYGVTALDGPATPETVWRLIRQAGKR